MGKKIATYTALLFAFSLIAISAYLAYLGIPNWGWFLFFGVIFGGVSTDLIHKL